MSRARNRSSNSRTLSPLAALLALTLVAIYLVQILLAVQYQTQTYDEGYHLAAGYRYWQCGDFGINPEHPPLVKLVAAAPLWLSHVAAPPGVCGAGSTTKDDGYAAAFSWYYQSGLDADRIMSTGRYAVSIFSLLLAGLCFLFAKELFGESAALLALLLLAFEPTLLAHGALVTTDTGVSALMLASVYAFYRYARQKTPARLAIAGVVTGFTLVAKHSGVLVLPILLVLTIFEAWRGGSDENRTETSSARSWLSYLRALAIIVTIAVGVLWTFYGWRFAARPNGVAMSISLSQFLVMVQEQGNHSFLIVHVIPLIARLHLLPQAYLYGFVDVLQISNPGQPPFLLGKLYPHGQWFYFPITFFIKSTLGFLGLFALAIFAVPWRKLGLGRQVFYAAVPPAILMSIALTSGLNIGYRHILPIIPFLCVLLGAAASYFLQRSRAWQVAVVVLLAWHVVSSLRTFPNYIPYSNEAFGGPSRTYLYLTDANADWGQGVKQVKTYLDAQNITDCWWAYDGITSFEYYGVPCKPLPPNVGGASGGPIPTKIDGTVLLSAMTVSGIEWENDALNPYREFLHRKPDAVIDGSTLVFKGSFDMSEVAAVQHIALANRFNGDGKFAAAKVEAQQGLALMPNSVRGYIALGRALTGLHQDADAHAALDAALRLANAQPEWYPNEIAAAQRELRKLPG